MRGLRSLTLLAAVCALAAIALADPPMTKLRVEVKNNYDKPVDRASVVVKLDRGRSAFKLGKKTITSYELRTNQEGVANVPSLPQGKITIMVIAKGYQTYGQLFDVKEEEKTIQVKLNPPQPQYSAHE